MFGRCDCCTEQVESTAGCLVCNSVRTYCASCMALTACGCGKSIEHQCPNYTVTAGVVVSPPHHETALPEGFITETGILLN